MKTAKITVLHDKQGDIFAIPFEPGPDDELPQDLVELARQKWNARWANGGHVDVDQKVVLLQQPRRLRETYTP